MRLQMVEIANAPSPGTTSDFPLAPPKSPSPYAPAHRVASLSIAPSPFRSVRPLSAPIPRPASVPPLAKGLPVSRRTRFCAPVCAALALLFSACDLAALDARPPAAPVIPEGPVPLERPKLSPEEQARADRRAFEAAFAPSVREALRDLDWEPLSADIELPQLAYRVQEACPVGYVQNARLSTTNDLGGLHRMTSSLRFVLGPANDARKKGATSSDQSRAVLIPAWLTIFEEEPDHTTKMHVIAGQELKERAFDLKNRQALFRGASSPIFVNRVIDALNHRHRKNAPPMSQALMLDFFPELPASPRPGAEASWNYNLVFDSKEVLAKRPPAQVRLETWLRVREQRVAYLTARWPADDEVWIATPNLPLFHLLKRHTATTYLQQKGAIEGHFLVSENGFVLLAHFEGVALATTESKVRESSPFRHRVGSPDNRSTTVSHREEVYFDFMTKALEDCNGTFLRQVAPAPISTSAIEQLAGEFISLFTIGRKKDALKRLSPEIRYTFTDEFISHMLTRHFELGGMESFGKPFMAESDVVEENALAYEGINKSLKTKTYSTFRGEVRDGVPVLTFIGASSSPARDKWDLLELSRNNIHIQLESPSAVESKTKKRPGKKRRRR